MPRFGNIDRSEEELHHDEIRFCLEAGAGRRHPHQPSGCAVLLRPRYAAVLDGLEKTFGAHTEAGLYSAPGRTEIGGNHTDHQHGRVLAGSVNIDMIAAAAPNSLNQLRVQSEGYDLCVIDLSRLVLGGVRGADRRHP